MQDDQFIVGFDTNARFVHLFQAEAVDLPVNCEEFVGKQLGEFAGNESDSRLLRATFAECLFTAKPQECVAAVSPGIRLRFRFEKVIHHRGRMLRSEDEVVALGVITKILDHVELTERERQIVQLVCRDMTNSEIANALKIKASTIETHRQNIRRKLNVKGTAGMVLYALRHGLAD